MYPALCFVDVTSGVVPDDSKTELQNSLSSEEYELISDNKTPLINFKFKLIEFFAKQKFLISKNDN